MSEMISVKEQAWEFFVYANLSIVPKKIFKQFDYNSYIGIKKKEAWEYDEYRIFMCAKAAYKDLCRTLTYIANYKDKKDSKKEDLKKKESAINNICFELTKKIYKYYNNGSINNIEPEKLFSVFITKYGIIKENFELLSYLEKPKDGFDKFYFGQAQKWVNMTLKYLYLLGLIDSDDNLPIPIDSYIIDATWEIENFSLPLPLKDKESTNRKYKYNKPSDYVVAWSKWTNKLINKKDKGEYDLLQEKIEKIVKSDGKNYKTPLDWEHENWIRIAEKRKGIEITSK